MKIAKTLAAAALCLSVCSAAFAAPAVKTFDVHEGSVKIDVPQIKGAAGGKFADNKINNTLNFYVLKQLYTALPLSMRNYDVMRTAYYKTFKAKDGSEEAREFVEDVAGFVNFKLRCDLEDVNSTAAPACPATTCRGSIPCILKAIII